jgi:hypothetical protein
MAKRPSRTADAGLVELLTVGSAAKRVRSAYATGDEAEVRRVIRSAVPDATLDIEEALIVALNEQEAAECARKEFEETFALEEAEALASAFAALKVCDAPCPVCAEGDLRQEALDRSRFRCDSCALHIRDGTCKSLSDVRARLALVLEKHSSRGCACGRPLLEQNGRGGLKLACVLCHCADVIFDSA